MGDGGVPDTGGWIRRHIIQYFAFTMMDFRTYVCGQSEVSDPCVKFLIYSSAPKSMGNDIRYFRLLRRLLFLVTDLSTVHYYLAHDGAYNIVL